jgi:hypothetical protein
MSTITITFKDKDPLEFTNAKGGGITPDGQWCVVQDINDGQHFYPRESVAEFVLVPDMGDKMGVK